MQNFLTLANSSNLFIVIWALSALCFLVALVFTVRLENTFCNSSFPYTTLFKYSVITPFKTMAITLPAIIVLYMLQITFAGAIVGLVTLTLFIVMAISLKRLVVAVKEVVDENMRLAMEELEDLCEAFTPDKKIEELVELQCKASPL